VGVINQFVFDTGEINSVQLIASGLTKDVWREKVKNLAIRLETPQEGKNVNIDIRPTYLRRITRGGKVPYQSPDSESPDWRPAEQVQFGIIVNVDINNQQTSENLTDSEVRDIVTFANDYVPEELIKFLNNER
jgi:hypothetical protein